jgi:putative membrane protein
MWGMHWAGWVFWILVIIGVIWLLTRSQYRSTSPPPSSESSNETPMEILKRKYAAGELSTEEYEERKEHLQRDQ